jgi:N-acetylglucosamine kinase-like BadF-type ATPase
MNIFLGVDGGQSSTTAMVGDESGRVLGLGRGGPCNHVSGEGAREKFVTAIEGAVAAAAEKAGLGSGLKKFAAGCFGFSGGAEDKQALVEEMFSFEKLLIAHDGLIALSGATGGRPGVISIAGTGQMAFGRNKEGRTARAGGWGHVFGDEGGGFDIVRQALRASLRMEEGWGPATALREKLLSATGAASANELLHWFYSADWPRPRIAGLSKVVDAAAREGDRMAKEQLMSAAEQLARYAIAVRSLLFEKQDIPRIAYIGGVFKSQVVRNKFCDLMGTACGPPEMGPAAGALLEAYRIAGVNATLRNVPEREKS